MMHGCCRVAPGCVSSQVEERQVQAGADHASGFHCGGGFSSAAWTVSADGTLIGGEGTTGDGTEAFLWDAANGMRKMSDVLALAGIDTTGWQLRSVEGIAADGRVFVGRGINPDGDNEGWYANLTPVLEPGIFLALTLATAIAGCRRRRSSGSSPC